MFANQQQQCEAIRLLLTPLHLNHLWTVSGPTKLACQYLEQGSPYSHGEQIMLRAAFDFWNGMGKVTLGEISSVLDSRHTELVATLLAAVTHGPQLIEAWIQYQKNRTEPPAPTEMNDAELLGTLGLDPAKWKIERPYTDQQILDWADQADHKGGSFVKSAARTVFTADTENFCLLKPFFIKLLQKYPRYLEFAEAEKQKA